MSYYKIDCYPGDYDAVLSVYPTLPETDRSVTWMDGSSFDFEIKEPFKFEIEEDDHGNMLPLLSTSPLVITSDMVDALRESGVDNIDVYDAEILDEEDNKTYTNYKAVNVIGMISATDQEKSKIRKVGDEASGFFINWFDKLVLEDSQTHGLLMFRLAEKPSFIFVHNSVKEHLIKEGFDRLSFVSPEKIV